MYKSGSGEAANTDIKKFGFHNLYQGSAQRRKLDTFHTLIDRSSLAILIHLVEMKLEHISREEMPADVKALLKNPKMITK